MEGLHWDLFQGIATKADAMDESDNKDDEPNKKADVVIVHDIDAFD